MSVLTVQAQSPVLASAVATTAVCPTGVDAVVRTVNVRVTSLWSSLVTVCDANPLASDQLSPCPT